MKQLPPSILAAYRTRYMRLLGRRTSLERYHSAREELVEGDDTSDLLRALEDHNFRLERCLR